MGIQPEQVMVMSGGALVTQSLVKKIGAVYYGANAASVAEKAKEFVL